VLDCLIQPETTSTLCAMQIGTTSFKTKLKKAQRRDLMYELRADGSSEWREMSVREIYDYVQACVVPISALTPPWDRKHLKTQHSAISEEASPVVSATSTPVAENHKRLSQIGNQQKSGNNGRSGSTFLHARDLRQLFSANSASEPAIAVRRHVVLVNFETIRAIVLVDRMILLVPMGADSELRDIERELTTEHDEIPEFEIRAYEALLSVSSISLARELKVIGT
jgi:hypothetical protein